MSAQRECWPAEGPRADARVSRAAPQGQTTPMGRPEHREGGLRPQAGGCLRPALEGER